MLVSGTCRQLDSPCPRWIGIPCPQLRASQNTPTPHHAIAPSGFYNDVVNQINQKSSNIKTWKDINRRKGFSYRYISHWCNLSSPPHPVNSNPPLQPVTIHLPPLCLCSPPRHCTTAAAARHCLLQLRRPQLPSPPPDIHVHCRRLRRRCYSHSDSLPRQTTPHVISSFN